MKKIIFITALPIILLVDIITGRTILNGLDSLIPRTTTPLPKPFVFRVKLEDGREISREIQCEEYYDTEGAEDGGGNFWAIRERGMRSLHDHSRLSERIPGVGNVSFVMPSCSTLAKGGEVRLGDVLLLVNGVIYGHAKVEENTHTYIPRVASQGGDISLEFEMDIDGKKLR